MHEIGDAVGRGVVCSNKNAWGMHSVLVDKARGGGAGPGRGRGAILVMGYAAGGGGALVLQVGQWWAALCYKTAAFDIVHLHFKQTGAIICFFLRIGPSAQQQPIPG